MTQPFTLYSRPNNAKSTINSVAVEGTDHGAKRWSGTEAEHHTTAFQPLLDPAVIARARTGDVNAFNCVVATYRRRVLGVINRLTSRPEDVEDVAQEVFFRLHRSLPALREPATFEPWLYRIILNATRDYLRRRQRSSELRMADLDEEQAASALASAAARSRSEDRRNERIRDEVDALLSRIPPEDRMLLLLKEVEGLSLEELEQVYGVPVGALKGRLFRARQRTLKVMSETM